MMLLDTSVWVDHFRRSDPVVTRILDNGSAAIHTFVIGELACGYLAPRDEAIDLLRSLPCLDPATDDEVLKFIETRRLMGRGIGYIDAHLVAAAILNDAALWTKDRRLHEIAVELKIAPRMN
jgi:predicted nucleic acid-binding protein